MKKIKIFLASSNELEEDRRKFEIEIYRKTKSWFSENCFLHLDIWEDLSARISQTGSQSIYNKFVAEADIFVLLAYSKVGRYTAEEFQKAFGQFTKTEKPFIYTYFREGGQSKEESLGQFKEELKTLKHFYSQYKDSNDLWNQFNKELDRLLEVDFKEHSYNEVTMSLEKNIVKGEIKDVANVSIGDNGNTNQNNYQLKNIVGGNIENIDDFRLGDNN